MIDALESADAVSIKKAQVLMGKPKIRHDLAFLSANYTFLCGPLKGFQQHEATLWHSFEILLMVEKKLASVQGSTGSRIYEKFKAVLKRNQDLERVKLINRIINGEEVGPDEITAVGLKLSPSKIASFKFSPVTSVDAERSFSMLKALLSDRRRSMTVKTLEMSLIAHFEL